jgi:hypothetical protein
MNHVDAARWHTSKRLWQRFGLAMGIPELKKLEAEIVAGRAQWLADQRKNMRSVYKLRVHRDDRTREIVAVFDVHLWAVVTVLPSEAWIGRRKRR